VSALSPLETDPGMSDPQADEPGALRAEYQRCGQGHVFGQWSALDAAARRRLVAQAARIDPSRLRSQLDRAVQLAAREPGTLAPVAVDRLPECGGDVGFRERAAAAGHAQLAAGEVAVLVLAGGQGTRLGFSGPKGALPVGPVSDRSLFELQAQKLRGAVRRCGRPIPWLVMTSPATDAATRQLFERSGRWGVAPEDVWFFCQGTAPSLDFDGRLLLAAPDRIVESPDGHGGCLEALVASGTVERLRARGIRRITTHQVDNPLVRIADPVSLGAHELREADMSCKVVAKRSPEERAGTVAMLEGQIRVIEYTEIDPHHRDLRDPHGDLVFWPASIGMHVLELDFVERVGSEVEQWLPYHASAKRIPWHDPAGPISASSVVPDEPNGYKLERFVFDALRAARRTALLEVRREDEYAPIKKPDGGESPRAARKALTDLARRWLAGAGIEGAESASWIELDQSCIDGPGEARRSGIRHVTEAPDRIRVATGEAT
jgi:UDP-N-acetylglucosamine/UDP-N-acetylgalactosamine diphosphorylase